MKYTMNGAYRTTEDGRYTIKKNYVCKSYSIRDNKEHCNLYEADRSLKTFNTLKSAKEYIERLYEEA